MNGNVQLHYTYNNKNLRKVLKTKGYSLSNGYTYKRLINTLVEIFLRDYLFLDCENHVLITDEDEDIPNTEIEQTIFNVLALYTEIYLHSLQKDELVSDIVQLKGDILAIYVHDLKTDYKKPYYLTVDV